MAKKKGLISRLIEGPERSETYAASTLPSNRWELGWDVFKTNKGKMVGLNLLTLVFFLPFFFLLFLRYVNKLSLTGLYPFGQNLAGGYPFFPASAGLEAQLELVLNRQFFLYLVIAVAIAAVGISGGFYVMRNMIWTESVSVGSDFFKGVKQNYFVVFFSLLLYSAVVAVAVISVNISNYLIASGSGVKWLLVAEQAVSIILIAFSTIMVLYMISAGITYKLKFFALIKNSFLFTVALLPVNVFFVLFASVFFLIFLLGFSFLTIVAVLLAIFFSLSMFMLVWTNYTQWVFDKYVNDRVAGAKKNRGIYKRETTADGSEIVIERSKYVGKNIKPVTDYDVEIYELPVSFTRKDLERLEETKAAMRKDSDDYAAAHAGEGEPDNFAELLDADAKGEDKQGDNE